MFGALVTMAVMNKLFSVLSGVKNKIKLLSRLMFSLLANVASLSSRVSLNRNKYNFQNVFMRMLPMTFVTKYFVLGLAYGAVGVFLS
jgi:hypothetical protein